MATMSELKDLFGEWIATVARTVDTAAGRFLHSRQILLREGRDDIVVAKAISVRNAPALPEVSFRLDKGRPTPPLPADWEAAFRGSHVEAVLQSDHVMFSPLDFPSQAGDFLEGMLREQVDRLTPWTVREAIFGWSQPTNAANDRIEVIFAATSKLKIQPLLQFAQSLEVQSVAVFATASVGEGTPARIKLFDESLLSAIGRTANVPRILRTVLLSAGLAAAASLLVAAYFGSSLQSEQQELQHRISQRRAALRLDPNAGGSALSLLAKRKQTTPSSVMVLEAVSRVLPDSTYVTELRIEGDKVQVVG
ncbi:MAG: PilN domain-containing protein, partial [Bradyrhizobium sp.]|nr:PilN domain-containing protein [Bradyrhizobium sp.]